MSSILSNLLIIAQIIFFFGIIIVVHEFGHYLAAKLVGIRVEKFSIGMGPKIAGFTVGETLYQVCVFPIGGYIKLAGEDPEEDKTGQPWEFYSKPPLARIAVIASGPLMNFILAFLVLTAVYIKGVPSASTVVGEVKEGYPAAEVLRQGDTITAIDGIEIKTWDDLVEIVQKSAGISLALTIDRDDTVQTVSITPVEEQGIDILGKPRPIGIIGISPTTELIQASYGPLTAADMAGRQTVQLIHTVYRMIWYIVTGKIPLRKAVGGPLLIGKMAAEQAKEGAVQYFSLMVLFSISLGAFNLLPVPVLDGGHIMFMTLEMIRRKRLPQRVEEIAQQVGLVLLLTLFIFATYNDILKIFV